jgi:hypothetical protein
VPFDEFSDGRSIWSITNTGTIVFSGCSFSPNCSCSAVKISGASSIAAGSGDGPGRGAEKFSVVEAFQARAIVDETADEAAK